MCAYKVLLRNNSNYTVLLRNCSDVSMNKRAAKQLGGAEAYQRADHDSSCQLYPAFFIDQSPKGKISGHQLYTDIFSSHQIVYDKFGMKGFVIPESDFKLFFEITEKNKAKVKNDKFETTSIKERRLEATSNKRKRKKHREELEKNLQ